MECHSSLVMRQTDPVQVPSMWARDPRQRATQCHLPPSLACLGTCSKHHESWTTVRPRWLYDEVFECIAKVEADLGRVAKLMAENEGLHSTDRMQTNTTLVNLTRRMDDVDRVCNDMWKSQEQLQQKVEQMDATFQDG
mmetsp:Transcript_13152/g.30736  ORF Transcript_13152/g.30736 Transcript_13152/m.30736 type:complete len:138 (+) Transcript_13152:141-554(+)